MKFAHPTRGNNARVDIIRQSDAQGPEWAKRQVAHNPANPMLTAMIHRGVPAPFTRTRGSDTVSGQRHTRVEGRLP